LAEKQVSDAAPLWRRIAEYNSVKQQFESIEKLLAPEDPTEAAGIYETLMKARNTKWVDFPD
jgi:hypothetical protein